MAFTLANRGLYTLLNSAITGSTDIRALVIKGAVPAAATIRDLNTVAELLAESGVVEAAAAGYSRADLASLTLTEVDASDDVTLTAAAPSWTSVAVGETWLAQAYFIEGASDAARTLIGVDAPASSLVTNGGNVTGPALSLTVSQGA